MQIQIQFTPDELMRASNSGVLENLFKVTKSPVETGYEKQEAKEATTTTQKAKEEPIMTESTEKAPWTKPEEEPKVTLEQLRAKLATMTKSGKSAEVKALLNSVGANKLTEVPPEKYAELWKAAGGDKQ